DLQWTNPTDPDVETVRLSYGPTSGALSPYSGPLNPDGTRVDGLESGVEYTLILTVVDDDGNESDPVTATVLPYGEFGSVDSVILNVADGCLTNVTETMEYSLDGGGTWTLCSPQAGTVEISFSAGDEVWVRQRDDASTERYLGTIAALSGIDLYPGSPIYVGTGWWTDDGTGAPGDSMRVMFSYQNAGTSSGGSLVMQVTGYLSENREITATDTVLFQTTTTLATTVGDNPEVPFDFTVPAVAPGVYYIGVTLDSADQVAEMVEGNNTSPSVFVGELRIVDSAVLPSGGVKVVNSWGDWGGWDNIPDGHYWITYETLKYLQSPIYYYYNDFSAAYEPTVLAVFELSHPYRDECWIKLGIGDPDDPVMVKDMQAYFYNGSTATLYSGHLPFPSNAMAVDVSEFAALINDHDLYLEVENLGSTVGSVDRFTVEFYSDYDSPPFKIITGPLGAIADGPPSRFVASTAGSLTASELVEIQPLPRSDAFGTTFLERTPTEEELARDMARIGVYEPGRNYNVIVDGFGTGLMPPTEAEWQSMVRLDGISSGIRAFGTLPDSIDNSATKYFPPVGSQANEGSCVAFSVGYYIHTYQEAREHDWDLSGVSWTGGYYGEPATSQDRIMSPDFVYHQINEGVDAGSSMIVAVSIVTLLGASSWTEMPYDPDDHTSWPSESAYREAARYRGAPVGNLFWINHHNGYFTIQDDADIDLLKQLLAEGYCLSISVHAGDVYDNLDSHDVLDTITMPLNGTNHANTVVGYKENTAWNPVNPDG
ncbi:MAG: hypothetical protein KAU31_10640, partial [Spirochaetaceae bacterium]|nr:hypothetical protein [Spirochaetaceae bacterium]